MCCRVTFITILLLLNTKRHDANDQFLLFLFLRKSVNTNVNFTTLTHTLNSYRLARHK